MDAKIKSPNHTNWGDANEVVKQPNGVNYNELFEKLSNIDKPKVNDLRKTLSKESADQHVEIDETVEKLDSKSLIPVPGLLIEHENSESEWMPSSEWQTPKGIVWGQ